MYSADECTEESGEEDDTKTLSSPRKKSSIYEFISQESPLNKKSRVKSGKSPGMKLGTRDDVPGNQSTMTQHFGLDSDEEIESSKKETLTMSTEKVNVKRNKKGTRVSVLAKGGKKPLKRHSIGVPRDGSTSETKNTSTLTGSVESLNSPDTSSTPQGKKKRKLNTPLSAKAQSTVAATKGNKNISSASKSTAMETPKTNKLKKHKNDNSFTSLNGSSSHTPVSQRIKNSQHGSTGKKHLIDVNKKNAKGETTLQVACIKVCFYFHIRVSLYKCTCMNYLHVYDYL